MSNRTDGVYDFDRAYRKAFWRRVVAWIMQKDNDLLPFDEVKSMVPMRGERYLGLREVPICNIVGSMGRHQEFDRAFLPTGTRTRDRWINIDLAYRDDVNLPAVDLYKIGDIYFVKDGNHRVSVARQRGQIYIDAYVTEISVPVQLTPDLTLEDLEAKQTYAEFLEST